ncbi:NUDIX hydrolase [Phaeacidiphilus oryzae]|uniref:NUDIX hydrolase n=1 Tax=Phaeacidiphilus oryzae TaxID=348818 RepID=UPI00056B0B88|nr:NUDIX hydrolase [Phaeacidiphilus oryzae]
MTDDGGPELIRAAGVLLWRPGADGSREIALVHRPKYDDWSFPKGKLDPGEDWAAAALRETWEETGLTVRLGARLPSTHYLSRGRPKEVRYWAAEPADGAFQPNPEVDELVWVSPGEALTRLTYPYDRALLIAFLRA